MDDLLTTKQLQELLRVDRTTIYRMLSDGRLRGIRVGGQWRFPREALEQCFSLPSAATRSAQTTPELEVLPLDCLQPVQEIFAAAANVGAVTTTIEGKPVLPMTNSCKFCDLILATPEGRKRCEASWARLAAIGGAPRLERCHAGLGYARGRVQIGEQFIGMIFAGQFVTTAAERRRIKVAELARVCGIDEKELRHAAREVRLVEPKRVAWLLNLLQKMADTFSHIARRQMDLMERLRQVAQLARV